MNSDICKYIYILYIIFAHLKKSATGCFIRIDSYTDETACSRLFEVSENDMFAVTICYRALFAFRKPHYLRIYLIYIYIA